MEKVITTLIKKVGDNLQWELRVGRDNKFYCSCPSWRFRKGKGEDGRVCKHIAQVLDILDK